MNRWIVCLKHGTKYNYEYVNKLYNMCRRNSKLDFNFACITEDSNGLNQNIKVIPIPSTKLNGWWYKPYVFSKDIPLEGTIVFMDLDLVIINNIDHLWSYEPDKFCIIRDFNRKNIPGYNKFNSSIFKFLKGSMNYVWENLTINLNQTKQMHGDQDWIFRQVKSNYVYWPDEWFQSYKWEVRSRQDIIIENNKRKFKNIINPTISPSTSILVFHGDPKPEEVSDPIIVDNWR